MFAFAKNQMIATQNSQQCVGVSKELDGVLAVKCVNQQSQWWRFDQEVNIDATTEISNFKLHFSTEGVDNTHW